MGRFGYIDEIVVDKNNILIAGHGRLESIKKMGYDSVEVKVLDIDSKDSKELRILHNKLSEYDNEYHLENLKIEIDLIGYDVKLQGLDVSMKELYPEFDAPAFNPDDYQEEAQKEKMIAVTVRCKDM
jgi:type I site-specific restriction-modification system R (restriction) subunit